MKNIKMLLLEPQNFFKLRVIVCMIFKLWDDSSWLNPENIPEIQDLSFINTYILKDIRTPDSNCLKTILYCDQ